MVTEGFGDLQVRNEKAEVFRWTAETAENFGKGELCGSPGRTTGTGTTRKLLPSVGRRLIFGFNSTQGSDGSAEAGSCPPGRGPHAEVRALRRLQPHGCGIGDDCRSVQSGQVELDQAEEE